MIKKKKQNGFEKTLTGQQEKRKGMNEKVSQRKKPIMRKGSLNINEDLLSCYGH